VDRERVHHPAPWPLRRRTREVRVLEFRAHRNGHAAPAEESPVCLRTGFPRTGEDGDLLEPGGKGCRSFSGPRGWPQVEGMRATSARKSGPRRSEKSASETTKSSLRSRRRSPRSSSFPDRTRTLTRGLAFGGSPGPGGFFPRHGVLDAEPEQRGGRRFVALEAGRSSRPPGGILLAYLKARCPSGVSETRGAPAGGGASSGSPPTA